MLFRSWAQYNVGVAYDRGEKVKVDYTEARKWYELAAQQGFAEAQCNLGVLYFNGDGEPKDVVEAYKWFTLAARQGVPKAIADRNTVADKLTVEQLLDGRKRALTFVPRRTDGQPKR